MIDQYRRDMARVVRTYVAAPIDAEHRQQMRIWAIEAWYDLTCQTDYVVLGLLVVAATAADDCEDRMTHALCSWAMAQEPEGPEEENGDEA